MSGKFKCGIAFIIAGLSLSGCAGEDRILFVTKTNLGLDIDSKPPTAEITIARRELAITPSFRDAYGNENTLPLLASFGLRGNFLNPEITSRFAGGPAAIILAEGPAALANGSGANTEEDFSICLQQRPDTRPLWKWLWHKITFADENNPPNDNTRAFYFATDTSFGLKVGWDGTSGPYPDTLKLGYNRKELAFPPIFAKRGCSKNPPPPAPGSDPWEVTVPSFVASLDNSSTVKELSESGVTHIQFFATGKAATEFVKRPDVNAAMNKKMFPHDTLTVAPMSQNVFHGATFQFNATGGVAPRKFSISDNQSVGAKIDENTGLYTAGSTADKADKVKVTDSSSPPVSIEATVNVQ